jgi:hypothetical protein
MHPPSPQQTDILNALADTNDNLSVRALAGTGKTTTIEMCQPIQAGLNVAFNRVVRETFIKRMPHATNHTFNSLGHDIITKALGKRLKFDADKIKGIRDDLKIRWKDCPDLFRILDLARGSGFGFNEHKLSDATDLGLWQEIIDDYELETGPGFKLEVLPEILRRDFHLAAQGHIDYGDQLWYPVVANLSLGLPPGIVYVDEAQDVNGIQMNLIKRYARRSRIVLVGDPHQAIYGFRGSVNESMGILESALGAKDFPLSVTYRCPKSVVRLAQSAVPEYTFADEAPEGEVLRLGKKWTPKDIESGSVILCRNNAPIIQLALTMIAQGIPASVRGRDIGKSLITLAKKIAAEYHPRNRDQFERALDVWRANQLSSGKKSEGSVNERADALLALLSGCSPSAGVEEITRKAERLFTDKESPILLSTIHKAKGLEWPTVYFLNEWMIPSHFAKTEEALRQESNIWYVGVTRTMNKLVFIETGKA